MTKEQAVLSTLAEWRRGKVVYGQTDCMLSAANYWLLFTGKDPAEKWRGSYFSEAQAQQIMEKAGGGLALMAEGLKAVGARKIRKPKRGDLVCVEVGDAHIAALCLGSRVAFRQAGRGMLEFPLERLTVLGGWRA